MPEKNHTIATIGQILQKYQDLTLQECVGLFNFLFDETEAAMKLTGNAVDRSLIFVFHPQNRWWDLFHQFNEDHPTNESDRRKRFLKHGIAVLQVLNKETQNQPQLFEQIITRCADESSYFFKSISDIFLLDTKLRERDGDFNGYAQEKRCIFEAGMPRVEFLYVWNKFHAGAGAGEKSIRSRFAEHFDEGGTWDYEPDAAGSLKLVFKHCVLSDFPPPSCNPYTPWAWLLSWQSERLKNPSLPIKQLALFLEKMLHCEFLGSFNLLEIPLFSKPGRTLCYFLLSELSLHPRNTDDLNQKLKSAQHYVNLIAQEHPWGLFDAQLPVLVLQHCGEMRLREFQPLLQQSIDQPIWERKEFLQVASRLFPAFHALLHAVGRPAEATLASPTEEYLKLLLQKFHPEFFKGQNEEMLPSPDSLLGKICFTLLPRCIEHFMHSDALIKKQIQEIAAQDPKGESPVINAIQIKLIQHREALARLTSEEIHRLLSYPDSDLQAQEARVRQKLLTHALESPNVILKAEEDRLTNRMTPVERAAPNSPTLAAIWVLKEGRRQISALNQQCIEKKLEPREHEKQVQRVLKQVGETGSKHSHSLTVVGRIAANVSIVLSLGLLYPLFKTAIRKTHITLPTDWTRFFYNLKPQHAATVHCVEKAQTTFSNSQ